MSVMKVKRVGVLSVAKIYGAIGAVIGFIIGFFIAVFSVVMGAFAGRMSFAFAGLGVFAIIAVPIGYGLLLFIFGAVGAWIYNVFAGWVGPVEIELE